ncbi:MAG: hypothetical protein HGB30_08815 [Holophagaceae bacterium]|nr:hypothetical protein [Holophagaceae bacterium]
MSIPVDSLLAALRKAYPTSHVRLLAEPAMFLRSNLGRSYTAEGMQIVSEAAALDYATAYMNGLTERAQATEGFELDPEHPWILGVFPGNATTSPLIFIFGNIVRNGQERWIEVGFPIYERLEF